MSYCRWTSVTEEGYSSDVYCYEASTSNNIVIAVRGWTGDPIVVDSEVDAATELIRLKEEGYNVPKYAIDALIESSKIDE